MRGTMCRPQSEKKAEFPPWLKWNPESCTANKEEPEFLPQLERCSEYTAVAQKEPQDSCCIHVLPATTQVETQVSCCN